MRADLVANGYVETNTPITGTIQGALSGDAIPALVNVNGVTYYVGYSGLLSSVLVLQ
jgi:hypothetical protein